MSWRQTDASDRSDLTPSRAINLDASEAAVREACAKHKLGISAVEPLTSGGVRLVMSNIEDAHRIRSLFKRQLLAGPVTRTRWAGRY